MNHFGLVTEGESDQVVIEYILSGYFDNPDLVVTANHPLRDATDAGKATGGWGNLKEYLKSAAFQHTFQTSEYVVIQLDTDVSEEYGVSKRDHNGELGVESRIKNTSEKIIEWIGLEVYDAIRERVIFAISVHEIECWLLPIYHSDKKREKTTGCINTLYEALKKKENFTIHGKEYRYYEKMAKPFLKRKQLDQYSPHNPSLKIFVGNLGSCRF